MVEVNEKLQTNPCGTNGRSQLLVEPKRRHKMYTMFYVQYKFVVESSIHQPNLLQKMGLLACVVSTVLLGGAWTENHLCQLPVMTL